MKSNQVRTLEAMYAEVESVTGFKIDWSLTEDLRRSDMPELLLVLSMEQL